MKKIYITKTDSPTVVVHKILSCPDDDIVLYVPKGSLLSSDPKNFKLLKREVSAVHKKVLVESVDGDALELASVCGFEVADAIFRRSKVPLMDIMPVGRKIDRPTMIIREECKKECEEKCEEVCEEEVAVPDVSEAMSEWEPKKKRPFRKLLIVAAVMAGLFGIGYLAMFVLPRAEVIMTMKKADWSFSGNVSASPAIASISADNSSIPSELFKISKNGIYAFPASGSKMVENKATGKLTIYNAYSSEAQPLVKNTRFVTPEGKIFRISSSITVPGAKVTEGKIIPSPVETTVTADSAGDTYNVGPVAKLRIPGFQGTPKYDGFYGELKEGASGGLVGELKIATDEDLKKAEETAKSNVEQVLRAEIMASIPAGYKVMDAGSEISVIKSGISGEANDKGEFTYGVMLEAKVAAFREEDMLSLMSGKFGKDHAESFDLKEYDLSYGEPSIDFSTGRIDIPVEFRSVWARSFDTEAFRSDIVGKSGSELKALIFSVPGVESGKADLWPIWVRSVPSDLSKITVSAE